MLSSLLAHRQRRMYEKHTKTTGYFTTQPKTRKSAAGLLPWRHEANIRMRSHRLLRLEDNKSAASGQQARLDAS